MSIPQPAATRRTLAAFIFFATGLLAACAPQYNWREVHGDKVPFTVLLPAKADSFTQAVTLNGAPVQMTMTAAEVDGVTFAVGTASFADETAAQNALLQMKEALIRNIAGQQSDQPVPGKELTGIRTLVLNATGSAHGQPLQMMGRLYGAGQRVYQVIVAGNPHKITGEAAETFFTSFQPG